MADGRLTLRGTEIQPAVAPSRRAPEADMALRIERRRADRVRARGQGVATFVSPDGRLCLSRVSLVDRSDSGLGVRSPITVAPGASFVISFDGAVSPIRGSVAHVRGRSGAFRLGLRCARRMAA